MIAAPSHSHEIDRGQHGGIGPGIGIAATPYPMRASPAMLAAANIDSTVFFVTP